MWVENHINFKEQGFTFGGEFQISTSNNEKLITLSISDNPHYFPYEFGGVITSVTAILGENGVGKSNLLDLLRHILTNQAEIGEDWIAIFKNELKDEIIPIHSLDKYKVEINGKLNRYRCLKPKKIRRNHNIFDEPLSANIDFLNQTRLIYYSPILDFRNYSLPIINKFEFNISSNFLLYNDKDGNYDIDPVIMHRRKNIERQYDFLFSAFGLGIKNKRKKKEIDHTELDINIPEHVQIIFTRQKFNEDNLSLETRDLLKWFRNKIGIAYGKVNSMPNEAHEKLSIDFLYSFLLSLFSSLALRQDISQKILTLNFHSFKGVEFQDIALEFFEKQKVISKNIVVPFIEEVLAIIRSTPFEKINIQDCSLSIPFDEAFEIWRAHNRYLQFLKKSEYSSFINLDWRDLSSGEKLMLDIFARLYEVYSNNIQACKSIKFVYILLDEGEVGFHPQWQKEYLNRLSSFFRYRFQHKFQLIITSHSPFVASDLPKSNIIFLQKMEDARLSVVCSMSKQEETFCANIHTLLSDAFFLRDGLIGALANEKVQRLIDWLNNKSNDAFDPVSAKALINIIGEHIIKQKLLEMYNNKMGIDADIERAEEEIKKLQEYVKKRRQE
ncbi:AAA family ATPase [Cytophagaceae bacterium YF14B1]|uniref:AAA family ATPase n=1 Tax=Xanthocytophaga flava TaxID=3048013 RepID=A0AAE3QPE6_9BACT|nr:AAA family ATPase [Xanthocytophaga flavus]MDJ1482451.1 AAA family ATPase [Xanthocytophaga flavus]